MNYDILDFPTAWKLCKTNAFPHDPKCSYMVSTGALLCDCGAVRCEWERLRKTKTDDFREHTCGECAWIYAECWCRRSAWGTDGNNLMFGDVTRLTPACPAYVPREKEKKDE